MRRAVYVDMVLVALLVVSCAGYAPNVLHVQVGEKGPASTRIEIKDGYLERVLSFGDVALRKTGPEGGVQAQVMLSNKGMHDVAFEYRFVWYDRGGYELPGVTAWLPALLGPGEERGFTSVAPARDAVSFRMMVRRPHGVTPTGS